jgi:hypothetical protein
VPSLVAVKWLLTTPVDVDLESLRQEVEAAGATLESRDPVPLDHQEQVLYAEGPDDLRERLSKTRVPVRVHRSSPIELY